MNCVLGDIAHIKAAGIPGEGPFVGRLVECVEWAFDDDWFGPIWLVKPLGWLPPAVDLNEQGHFAFPDSLLRPIRDPGPDAVDESLSWKPVPAPTQAPQQQPEHAE